MVKNRILISTATFVSLSLLGFTFTFVGALLPVMKLFFQINLSSAGLITVTIQIGYAVLLLLSRVSSGITSGIFLALTGLGFSGVFPGLLALTSLILPERCPESRVVFRIFCYSSDCSIRSYILYGSL